MGTSCLYNFKLNTSHSCCWRTFSYITMFRAVTVLFVIIVQVYYTNGHGRLMDPPARNAMWRYGFPNPVNYNDNELYCGGFAVHWLQNGGKCGVCGDPWHKPHLHETGGVFANGLIGRQYAPGQVIDIDIELSANHQGYFELSLCPLSDNAEKESQGCFDRYPLNLEGTSSNRFDIPEGTPKKLAFAYRVKLPDGVTCTHCVIQWIYFARNTWGTCNNGTESVGCGNQETFVSCADISILTNTGGFGPSGLTPVSPPNQSVKKTGDDQKSFIKTESLAKNKDLVVRSQVCIARGNATVSDGWCMENCLKYPPTCPEEECQCLSDCVATGDRLVYQERMCIVTLTACGSLLRRDVQ